MRTLSITRSNTSWVAIALFAMVLSFGLFTGDARAQDDCTSQCTSGAWYDAIWYCDTSNPEGSCQDCEVTCPGDDTAPEPEQQTP
jgi:hypothetical protein